jgi:hypothetical protein
VNTVLRRAAFAGTAMFVAVVSIPGATQQSAGPVARYTMDAGTMSGMAAMAAGGNPLALLRGGGGGAAHQLELRLGSSRAATGSPAADHFMPPAAGLGQSVPLETPVSQVQPTQGLQGPPQQRQMPSGKLYLFWGCGEHAGPGQPVVIDFSKMAKGQIPPGLFASGASAPGEWTVTQGNSRTFGEWPNSKSTRTLSGSSSLIGDHRISGNYSPDISFHLDHDFMAPLQPRSSKQASGAYGLTWNGLPDATGYYAWAIGAKDMGRGQANEMVWWTSSATKQFGGMLADWLSPAAVARLVAAKTVMPSSQTSCTVPAEVTQLGGENMMVQLYGYGPESNFAYPPRPASAKAPWHPQWIARVRFRSNAMVLLSMPDMGGFSNGGGEDGDRAGQPQPAAKPKCKGLKGIAQRAAGLCE